MKKTALSLLFATGLLAGCASAPQLASLATPANVQTTISVLGALAAPKLTAGDKAIVHAFATDLLSLAMANVDASNLAIITSKIPANVSAYTAGLIAAATADLNLALAKFGQHNATVLAYVTAVGNGLLSAGF
jgi:hypothetical protein